MLRKKYLVLGRSRGTGPRATVRGDFFLCSDNCEGQALALRCAVDFCMCSDDREGQALALRCAGIFLSVGQSRGTGPRATVCGDFFLCSGGREGQALALRCAVGFCM